MIETTTQRDKRIKGEADERAKRAAKHAEVIARQNAQLGINQPKAPAAPTDPEAPLTVLAAKKLNAELHREADNLADRLLMAKRREIWKPLGYSSWVDYCKAEWGTSKSRIYELVNFAETVETLKESAIAESPECEAQTRPLAGLPPSKQKTAWKRATKAAGGQPTAKQVAAQVAALKPAKARVVATEENLPMMPATAAVLPPAAKVATDTEILDWLEKNHGHIVNSMKGCFDGMGDDRSMTIRGFVQTAITKGIPK